MLSFSKLEADREVIVTVELGAEPINKADFNSSPLSKHVWSAGHHVDWDVSVLTTCPDYHRHVVTELFKIRSIN